MNAVKNEVLAELRHDLKGQIRRQDLIVDYIFRKYENGENDLDKPINDMLLSIRKTSELWESFLLILDQNSDNDKLSKLGESIDIGK